MPNGMGFFNRLPAKVGCASRSTGRRALSPGSSPGGWNPRGSGWTTPGEAIPPDGASLGELARLHSYRAEVPTKSIAGPAAVCRGPDGSRRPCAATGAAPTSDLVDPDPVHLVALAESCCTTSMPDDHLTEHGVLPVEVGLGRVADEELRAARVGRRRLGHGKRARLVDLLLPGELVLDGESRARRCRCPSGQPPWIMKSLMTR